MRPPRSLVLLWVQGRKPLALCLMVVAGLVALGLSFSADAVRVMHWLLEHWFNAVAFTAFGTLLLVVATLGVPFLTRRLDITDRQSAARVARERSSMLRRVRYKGLKQARAPSLPNAAHLALGLRRRTDALHLGRRMIRRPCLRPAAIPDAMPIIEVFDEVSGGLLILGAPGAGKTTLLLELADGLLDRAEDDPNQPIPVVLNLSSWAAKKLPLVAWLAEEIAVSYSVPRRTASAWVGQDALVLLLDGLDEVAADHRNACVEVINVYRREHGLVPIAVCSRTEEFEGLTAALGLDEAVELLPPSDSQIEEYLSRLEATGTSLGDVRITFATDRGLQELLRSPLMLHVIALAYHGQPAPALQEPGSLEERSNRLWHAYVERMFEQRPLGPEYGYTSQDATRWLGWLAWSMQARDQAEFHLGRLTSRWVPTESRQNHHFYQDWIEDIAYSTVQLDYRIQVSWKDFAQGLGTGFILFTCLGMLCEVIAWLFARLLRLPPPFTQWHLPGFEPAWLGSGLDVALAVGVIGGLSTGLAAGLNADLDANPISPGEGIRRATKYGLVAGLTMGIAAGLGTGLAISAGFGTAVGLFTGLAVAVVAALVAGMFCGGAASLYHHVIRSQLTRAGVAPRRYELFLDAMAERLLLRKSGSAYLFVHGLLREYLAGRIRDNKMFSGRDIRW